MTIGHYGSCPIAATVQPYLALFVLGYHFNHLKDFLYSMGVYAVSLCLSLSLPRLALCRTDLRYIWQTRALLHWLTLCPSLTRALLKRLALCRTDLRFVGLHLHSNKMTSLQCQNNISMDRQNCTPRWHRISTVTKLHLCSDNIASPRLQNCISAVTYHISAFLSSVVCCLQFYFKML